MYQNQFKQYSDWHCRPVEAVDPYLFGIFLLVNVCRRLSLVLVYKMSYLIIIRQVNLFVRLSFSKSSRSAPLSQINAFSSCACMLFLCYLQFSFVSNERVYFVLFYFILFYLSSSQILAVGAEPLLSRFDMNGDIISQIQCAPQSAFSMSLHPSGVITTYNGRNYEIITYVMSHGKFKQYIKISSIAMLYFRDMVSCILTCMLHHIIAWTTHAFRSLFAQLPSPPQKRKKEKKEKGKGIFSEIYSTFICLELLY